MDEPFIRITEARGRFNLTLVGQLPTEDYTKLRHFMASRGWFGHHTGVIKHHALPEHVALRLTELMTDLVKTGFRVVAS